MVYRQGSNKEEEWALQQEKAKLEQLRKQKEAEAEKKRAELDASEREERRKLHYMRCPKCGEELKTIAIPSAKMEIDECPSCKGVWLDQGEIERFRGLSTDSQRSVIDRIASAFGLQ